MFGDLDWPQARHAGLSASEFGISTSNGVVINGGIPKLGHGGLHSIGTDCLSPYKHAPPHVVYRASLDRCSSDGTTYVWRSAGKTRPRVQLLKVLKVRNWQSCTDRSGNYDFLLTYQTMGLCRTVSK